MNKFVTVLLLSFTLFLSGCNASNFITDSEHFESAFNKEEEKSEQEYNRITVPVTRVIDGDTIRVEINGTEERIRFLLIDTPEMNHGNYEEPQPFGEEATKFVEDMLKGGEVELELDVSERDRYGRILAYLYVDGESVQEELLRNGLARVAYIFPPNTRYVDNFLAIQEEAKNEGIGIWSIENYAQDDGFYPENDTE
ncbi:thermonuclease family protein [Bacillus sp. FJAT-45066]|uniref:thermonuclease family protein n=1 Tax=Bacillus sp. FJAT-45066 TaxID=2011010 RepID=UPI000BB8F890|nr:thermonuclease family protein [Bacillus sp. FJAT-45066]